MPATTLVYKRDEAKRSASTTVPEIKTDASSTTVTPFFPTLSLAYRTIDFLTLLSQTDLLRDAALNLNEDGKTVFEPLLEDVEGLVRVEADGLPVPRTVVDRVVNKLAEVAELWLRDDVCDLARTFNNSLHLHRMHVLRRVESLVANPRSCTAWSTLGLTVACLAEARRHNAGLRPLSVSNDLMDMSSRMEEAQARLKVRVRIQSVLHDAQMRSVVQPDQSLLILLWADTTAGLRLFAVQLNGQMVMRMALRDETASLEIAMATECRLVQAMQPRPPPIMDVHNITYNMGVIFSPQLTLRSDSGFKEDNARMIASDACLKVPSIDVQSETVLAVLREATPTGWMLRSHYASGLAVGLLSVDQNIKNSR